MDVYPILHKFINPTDSVLDLGSGIGSFSRIGITTTVDAWNRLNPDYLLDLEKEKLPFKEDRFDHIIMIDFIEHLDKEKGLALLEDCKKITKNDIILLTPLIWDDNSGNVENMNSWAFGNPYDYHKSLWGMEDFSGWEILYNDTNTIVTRWRKNIMEKCKLYSNGGIAVDDRGSLKFVNDFDFQGVKRFYQVENHERGFIRAWHGHQKEGKYVYVSKGSAWIGIVDMTTFETEKYVLSDKSPKVLFIPAGKYNGAQTLEEGTIIQYFSTSTIEESKGDDIRQPYDKFPIFEKEYR